MYGKLYATRRRGRPKMRWLDDASTDLRKMGINEWRDGARDREAWSRIVKEAKAHPGCSATEEEATFSLDTLCCPSVLNGVSAVSLSNICDFMDILILVYFQYNIRIF